MFLLGSNFFGTLCASWTCMSISSTKLRKFSLFFQICCQFLALSLLLLASLWFGYRPFWRCPRVFLFSLHFFEFLFLHSVLYEWLFLPYVPNHWFDSKLHPLHCWFPVKFYFWFPVIFYFQVMYICTLMVSFKF